jgi:hypothetical protein
MLIINKSYKWELVLQFIAKDKNNKKMRVKTLSKTRGPQMDQRLLVMSVIKTMKKRYQD